MRPLWLITFLVGICLPLAACSSASAVAGKQSVTLTIEGADDLSFDPDSLTVQADTAINLTFVNTGANPHSFAIAKAGTALFSVNEDAVFQGINTGEIQGGDSFRIPIAGLEPGSYTYVCLIAGHAAAGMVGTLTISEQ